MYLRKKSIFFGQKIRFILTFIVFFFTSEVILSKLIPYPQKIKRKEQKIIIARNRIPSVPSICTDINSILITDDIISITYPELPTQNKNIFSLHFALRTTWLNQQIFFPIGKGEVLSIDNTTYQLRFFLPVLDYYEGELLCSSSGINVSESYEDFKPFINSAYKVQLSTTRFANSTEYSQLKCHHKNSFSKRWCEYQNLIFFNNHFYFFSPAQFRYPEPFLVPGARAPPFDKTIDRFNSEPIVLNFKISQFPTNFKEVTDFSYIYGTFHNYYMLWHFLFDFSIPLWNHIQLLKPNATMNNSQVFVRNDGVWLFHCVANIFSHKGIQVLSIVRDTLLLRQGTVGIEKLEKNPDPNRDSNQMISFKYEVNRQNAIGFRDAVLESLKFPLNARKTNESKLLVIMIDRQTSHRRIVNQDEVVELMRNTCDFCDVRCIKFESLKVQEQISLVSKASVLVGLHGSGLAHVMWMHESTDEFPTYMIEVLPFGYICRDWYKVAANAAGVNYYAIMNKRAPSNSSSQLITCFNYPKLCSEVICHDSLRDQCVQLELKTFNQTWSNIVSELRKKL